MVTHLNGAAVWRQTNITGNSITNTPPPGPEFQIERPPHLHCGRRRMRSGVTHSSYVAAQPS